MLIEEDRMTNYNLQASREWGTTVARFAILSLQKRLERARNYARQGNVLSIKFGSKVGSSASTEPEPYQVSSDPFPMSRVM